MDGLYPGVNVHDFVGCFIMRKFASGFLVFLIVFAVMSSWDAWTFIKFEIWGKPAEAIIEEVVYKQRAKRRGGTTTEAYCSIQFSDGQKNHRAVVHAPSWAGVSGKTAMIDFIPGDEPEVRFHGARDPFWFYCFISILFILAVWGSLAFLARRRKRWNSDPWGL